MVTKRPLVLQLVTSQGQGMFEHVEQFDKKMCFFFCCWIEYAVFGHKPQQRFINYADVRAEIENDTKAVVRDDMGVSNLPINLTIFSPHGMNQRILIILFNIRKSCTQRINIIPVNDGHRSLTWVWSLKFYR